MTMVDLAAGSPEPRAGLALARAAESLGFDGCWVAETDRDPFIGLGLTAAGTSRIHLGTAVVIAFARSPVVLAATAWGLAELSGGRFELGLGTQVRGHITRRFGMEWSAPAPRLGEWIGAVRAAWLAWQTGGEFRFRSEHLDLSLMPGFFRPPPLPPAALAGRDAGHAVRVSIAGVGQPLARLAGRIAEGFHVHPFHTARYLAEVVEPAMQAGEATREPGLPSRVDRIVPVFLVPQEDAAAREAVRRQVAFYAATPVYRKVLELHERGRVGERLSRLAATGRWEEMAPLVDDELLGLVAVIAPRDRLADALAARVTGRADRVMPLLPLEVGADGSPLDVPFWEGMVATLRDA
jgi:probable F420-dependent oxidoreductase